MLGEIEDPKSAVESKPANIAPDQWLVIMDGKVASKVPAKSLPEARVAAKALSSANCGKQVFVVQVVGYALTETTKFSLLPLYGGTRCSKCGGPTKKEDVWDDPPEAGGACIEIVNKCLFCGSEE